MDLKTWIANFTLLTVGDRKRTAAAALGKVLPDGIQADAIAPAPAGTEFPGMRDVLVKAMKQAGADQWNMDAHDNYYRQAFRSPRNPLPCPRCLMKTSLQRLILLPGSGPLATLQCERCKTEYEVPSN